LDALKTIGSRNSNERGGQKPQGRAKPKKDNMVHGKAGNKGLRPKYATVTSKLYSIKKGKWSMAGTWIKGGVTGRTPKGCGQKSPMGKKDPDLTPKPDLEGVPTHRDGVVQSKRSTIRVRLDRTVNVTWKGATG